MARPRNKVQCVRVNLNGYVSPILYSDVIRWLDSLPVGKRFSIVIRVLQLFVGLMEDGNGMDEVVVYVNTHQSVAKNNIKRRAVSLKIRYEVFVRDSYKCVVCGRDARDGVKLEVDHIHPVSKGGSNEKSNLQTLCFDCNHGKKDKVFDENI